MKKLRPSNFGEDLILSAMDAYVWSTNKITKWGSL